LIATPIILDIINDSKESSNERSMELYASAVKNALAGYQLNNLEMPINFNDLSIEYDGNVKCGINEIYSDGSIYLAECKVNGKDGYSYGTKKENSKNEICKLTEDVGQVGVSVGDRYICEVKKGTNYNFYVLSMSNGKTNLITDQNICSDGTPATDTNSCTVEYDRNPGNGPEAAMDYLKQATLDWNDELLINEIYNDEGGFFTNFVLDGKARLPKKSEVFNISENPWIYYNLSKTIMGYWTLSYGDRLKYAYCVNKDRGIDGDCMANENLDYIGVRPVISISGL